MFLTIQARRHNQAGKLGWIGCRPTAGMFPRFHQAQGRAQEIKTVAGFCLTMTQLTQLAEFVLRKYLRIAVLLKREKIVIDRARNLRLTGVTGNAIKIMLGSLGKNMNNVVNIDGHPAVISFDPDIDKFRGEFIGLNGGADFYACSEKELKNEGSISLSVFLDECKKDGIPPYKSFNRKATARPKSS